MELSKIQTSIVKASESKVIVHSSAGSGKTRCLTERLKFLLQEGKNPEKIVAITFTRAAAEEITERIGRPKGLFVGTIHSYANQLLMLYGVDTSDLLETEKFDRLFERVKANIGCIQEVDYLLLDEGQDSAANQFEFCLEMVKPKNWMIFADVRQSIYRFAGAVPDYILNLQHQPDVVTYDLNENYRNGENILRYAQGIINLAGYEYTDHSIPMSSEKGRVIEVEFSAPAIAKTIKKYGNYKDWFILTRTNDQVDHMLDALKSIGVPCASFKRSQLKNKDLWAKLHEDSVKVLTIHTSKGLEAENVVVVGAKFYNLEEKCISYVAATRAKKLLVWTRTVSKRRRQGINNWEE